VQQRIRVASLQYFIRPVSQWQDFEAQVRALAETAADYKCKLLVFPEYFTCQLLTLGNVRRPIHQQIRDLAAQAPRFLEMMGSIAKETGLYIVGGTIPRVDPETERLHNDCFVFSPRGEHAHQGKLYMTRFEEEEWLVQPRDELKLFDTDLGRFAVTICYDVEFPQLARHAALRGADLLIVPSCTDDRNGFLRVRYCANARAIENQMYVVVSSTVGSLPMVPAVHLNYGQASILTPCDFVFSRDGVLAEGIPNQETMVIAELNLAAIHEARERGTVLPLRDARRAREIAADTEVVRL
jgi:predicted amidohydrolase